MITEFEKRQMSKQMAIDAIKRGESVIFGVTITGGHLVSDYKLNVCESVLQCDSYTIMGKVWGKQVSE